MSFYQINLAVFAAGNGYLLYRQYKRQAKTVAELKREGHVEDQSDDEDTVLPPTASAALAARKFQIDYFSVYALAVAADWLQGPHIYAIYKYEMNLPEKVVAALYAAGFISGALSATFAGNLADRYGRRLACLVYCASYAATCLTMLSSNLYVLLLGRLCGGVSTTLLFSVFEAWMISEFHARGLDGCGALELSDVFGRATTLSCLVAIASGIVGDVLVAYMGGRVWPFLAAAACCVAAGLLIVKTWGENHGAKVPNQTSSLADIRNTLRIIFADVRILSLGIASCVFEGTMYLVVFFWSAALKSARARAAASSGAAKAAEEEGELPFGLIFSSFMCAMMAGSALFSLMGAHTRENVGFMLMAVVLVVSCCLSSAVLVPSERWVFWAVCLVEACIGAYFPSMSFLKSEVVDDGVRGRVYSLLRMPLNVFVVVAHSLDEEGDAHRNHVFLVCAALLMVAFFVVKRNFSS
jgi:MFS family permease